MDAPELQQAENDPPDRRRPRRRISLRGYIVRAGGISDVIDLVDLNYGGCGITTMAELRPGESVQLTVLGRGSIPAHVRWFSDGRAGLDFTPSIKATRKQVPRRTSRVAVDAEVSLRALGRNSYRLRVFDLSTDGCKVELVERPSEGDRMLIKFAGLDVLEAHVCWVEGHLAGLMFKNRMHPAVLDLLLRRIGADAPKTT